MSRALFIAISLLAASLFVFGCGGDRDKTKRPVMGSIAGDICDDVILTNDNPRTESPDRILSQIEKGMRDKNKYSIIKDRRSAIQESLERASPGDIVLIAGKGHEDYQIIGTQRRFFDDRVVAAKAAEMN